MSVCLKVDIGRFDWSKFITIIDCKTASGNLGNALLAVVIPEPVEILDDDITGKKLLSA
jgi:hypothetical protein